MPDTFAVAALIRHRTELPRQCDALQGQLDQMRADAMHLEAAIRIMDPNHAPADVHARQANHKGRGWFSHGELGRLILEVLRDASEPLTAAAVA